MRTIFFILALLSVSAAIPLTVFEQRDFGTVYEEDFDDIRVTMDCEEDIITVYVTDEDEPATGAVVRLLYVDYSVPLLGAGPTDVDGTFSYTLVGDKYLMNGLFLVVVEKEGYKNKEAHFDIQKCVEEPEEEEEVEEEEELPPPPVEEEPEEITPPPVEEPEEEEEAPAVPPAPPVEEEPEVPEENVTIEEPGEEPAAGLCTLPFSILLLSLLLIFRW